MYVVEKEAAAFDEGPFAAAGNSMLLDHVNRWDLLPDMVKMTAALDPRTKGLDGLDRFSGISAAVAGASLADLKILFAKDIYQG